MTQPDPYPETREIPRVRPTGHVPMTNPLSRAVRPTPEPVRVPVPPRPPEPEPEPVSLESLFTEEPYPDPRSRNPLHRYGPQIFIVGAVAFVLAMIVLLITRLT